MNPRSFQNPLEQSTSVSINIIHEEINNNSEELEKIKKLVDENKKNGFKIPLIATVLLLFHNADNNTLKKNDLFSLMEKETINNKNMIISSPTERYCIINQKNYKSKIKDIIKKKKWFTKKMNENKEIEFTLNPCVVSSIIPRITSFFKVLAKNDYLFINKENEKEKENKEQEEEKVKKGKKVRKSKKSTQKNLKTEKKKEKKEKEKQVVEEKQITEEKQEEQEKEENNENIIEGSDDNEKVIDKKGSEEKINKKKNKSKIFMVIIKKEKDIQEKEEKIEDFEIIIEDDNENNNNISFNNTEERIVIPNIKDQKNESNENDERNSKYLNKKRKPNKKKENVEIKTEKEIFSHSIKIKTEKEEEISPYSIKNNIPYKEENPDMSNQIEVNHLNEKDSTKDEIEKGKTQNNKIDSIINFGEIFLKLIKSKKLSELASNKINSLKDCIRNKEKEIQFDSKIIEQIKQKEKEVNTVNIKEIEKKINEIKIINEEYKEKTEKLPTNKNVCENTVKDNKNYDNNNFNKNFEINEKMISDFSLIFNNYQNAGQLLNMILIDDTKENKCQMNIMNIENNTIEKKENVFNKSKTNVKLIKYDNYSDGKFLDLINCENDLDVVDANKNESVN